MILIEFDWLRQKSCTTRNTRRRTMLARTDRQTDECVQNREVLGGMRVYISTCCANGTRESDTKNGAPSQASSKSGKRACALAVHWQIRNFIKMFPIEFGMQNFHMPGHSGAIVGHLHKMQYLFSYTISSLGMDGLAL